MSCFTGKISYATFELAQMAMSHAQSVIKKGHVCPLRVYYCTECKRYHVTSQEKYYVKEKRSSKETH
jgi:hypothetical protein